MKPGNMEKLTQQFAMLKALRTALFIFLKILLCFPLYFAALV